MKNAIVYSIHCMNEDFIKSIRFRQLLYSVSRLRRFNKKIDVFVYLSDTNFFVNQDICKNLNINFVYFKPENYSGINFDYDNTNNADILFHRWTNTFKTLKDFDFDNVLYIDTDTVFYNDPEILFDVYGNTNSIYTKEDNCYDIMRNLGVDNNGLNAGQILFSKNLIETEKNMFSFMKEYINSKLLDIKEKVAPEVYSQTLWVIDQYALYEYYKSIGIKINIYDIKHVMLHLEPWIKDTSELVLHHYLNSNYKIAVPAEFVNDDNFIERFL